MTDTPDKSGGSPANQTSPKEEEEKPLTTRIREGVGRHLTNLNQLRTKSKAKLLKSLSQHEAKREDPEKKLSSQSTETDGAYSHTALPSSDRDDYQSESPPPYQFELPNYVRSSSPTSSGIRPGPRHLKGKAGQNFPGSISDEDHVLRGPYSTDMPTRVGGMANRKQSSYSHNTLDIPHQCSNSPRSHSGADNASERGHRALAAGVLVSPCLETKELIFTNKAHMRRSDLSLPAESSSSDDTLRLAVPLFTKDVHNAYKNVLRPDSQEVAKPPPEEVLPKSTIIVNRFGAGSPYFDISKYSHTHSRNNKPVDSSRYVQDVGSPGASNSPQRAAPVSFFDSTQAGQQYAMPHYIPQPLGPYTSMPFHPPSLSAPPLVVPQPGYYWPPQPSAPPMAHMTSQRGQYSRQDEDNGNFRQRPPASSFRQKLSSCFPSLFGFFSSGPRQDSSDHLPSYSQHQASMNNVFHSGARSSSFTETQRRRRSNECDPDDLLLQMACCCCWPIGLAAMIITSLFPRERDSCVGYLSRQMSLCALMLGIAVYLVIMIVFISLIAALSAGPRHY